MVLNKLLVIYQRRIFAQLFRDLGMAVHEKIHVCQLLSPHAMIVLAAIEALLLVHESIGILADLLTNFRMLLQILLQLGMLFDKPLVVYQRRILAKLFGHLGVTV